MSFSKFCQEKARSCLFYETDFSTYQADPFFGTWVPVGTIFAITAPVYLFLKKKGFIHLGVIFESLISSTILYGCFTHEIHRLRNWTGHCLSPDGERLLGPAIPLIYASGH